MLNLKNRRSTVKPVQPALTGSPLCDEENPITKPTTIKVKFF